MESYTDSYKQIIIPIILKYLPNARIILYGSRARHQEKMGSDIDIAIDNTEIIDRSVFSQILEEIEESLLPINFDVVDYHAISQDLKDEIEKDGIIWQRP